MFINQDAFRAAKALLRLDSPLRILIVEDNADLGQMMALLLRHCGCDVRTLIDGLLVLDTARAFRPHFILLDIGLPGLDGYEVAAIIRGDAGCHGVIIIAISAYGPDVNPERSRQAGFDHHLTKPVFIEDLLPLLIPG